jgi:hypothetical protein
MICEFCDKKLSNLSSLNYHKKTAKYCLKIQSERTNDSKNDKDEKSEQKLVQKIEIIEVEKINKKNEICQLCDKEFSTKKHLIQHLKNTCIDDFYKINCMIYELKTVKKLNSELERILKEKDIQIAKLETIIETKDNFYKEDHECLKEIAKNPKINNTNISTHNNTSNTTNKILSLSAPMNFNDLEKIQNLLNNYCNIEYILDGQKGFAKFAIENLLIDEEGNLKYICTDPSRSIFKYKDDHGDIQKDIEAKKLTNYLIDGGMKKKALELSIDWYTDENGNIDITKFQKALENHNEINKIDKDNTEFRKELISFITK